MPYISEINRPAFEPLNVPREAGELNYAITALCLAYLKEQGKSYATQAEIVGALECVKLEFYRRSLAPYEDGKIKANGDVYP